MERRKKLSICLLKLWIVCFAIFSIGSRIYISYHQVIVGDDPTIFVGGYHLFTAGIILLFFIPLLCVIHHFSKTSTSVKFHKVVTVMLVWLVLSEGLLLFCIMFAYIAPEAFAALTSLSK